MPAVSKRSCRLCRMEERISLTVSFTPGSWSINSRDLPPLAAQLSHQYSPALGWNRRPVCWEDASWISYQSLCGMMVSVLVLLGNATRSSANHSYITPALSKSKLSSRCLFFRARRNKRGCTKKEFAKAARSEERRVG